MSTVSPRCQRWLYIMLNRSYPDIGCPICRFARQRALMPISDAIFSPTNGTQEQSLGRVISVHWLNVIFLVCSCTCSWFRKLGY